MTVETRKIDELKLNNKYLRLDTDVSELERSIETLGLISPLVIDKNNRLLAGARRYQALVNLGFKEAPVIVFNERYGELEQELISIDENLVRKDLSKIEVEEHLKRAKEIYLKLFPEQESQEDPEEPKKVEKLPNEKFLTTISKKTGLSPNQIYQAISREEKATPEVKEARKQGKLNLSQTNEIIRLKPEDQRKSLSILSEKPVKEIKKFVKLANSQGLDQAIKSTSSAPFSRDYQDIEKNLQKVLKKLEYLKLEGINFDDFPSPIQDKLEAINQYGSSTSHGLYQREKTSSPSLEESSTLN